METLKIESIKNNGKNYDISFFGVNYNHTSSCDLSDVNEGDFIYCERTSTRNIKNVTKVCYFLNTITNQVFSINDRDSMLEEIVMNFNRNNNHTIGTRQATQFVCSLDKNKYVIE